MSLNMSLQKITTELHKTWSLSCSCWNPGASLIMTLKEKHQLGDIRRWWRRRNSHERTTTTPQILWGSCEDFRVWDVYLNAPRRLSSDWVKHRRRQTSEDGDAGINLQRRSKLQIIRRLSVHRHRYRLWFLLDCGNRRFITIYLYIYKLIKMQGGSGAGGGSQNITEAT